LIIQGTNFILPFITYPYLVRTLELEKYGLVMVAASFMVFFNILVDFGFNISATRYISIVRNDKLEVSKFFWKVYFVKLVLLFIAFLILLGIVFTFEKFRIEYAVYLLSFGLVFGQALFPTWFFQGIERMRTITIVNVMAKVLFTITMFIFIKEPEDYLFVPVLNSLGFIIAGLIGFMLSLKFIQFVRPKDFNIISTIKENYHLVISNFSTSIYTSGNTFILGMIAGDTLAGVYSGMEKLVMATKTLYTPLYQAIFPWLAKKSSSEIVAFIDKMKKPIAISGLFIAGLILIFAQPILQIIYADETITSYYMVFQLLGFIAFFASLNMLYVSLFYPALKMYKYRMLPMVSGGIINLFLALMLGYFFDIYGVALAAVFSEFMILVIAHHYRKKVKT
jgi:PST family polysaccharide transporter